MKFFDTRPPGPALGMFEVFGRTGPPILGGRQFCHTQVVDECNASVCSFVETPLYIRHLVVLHILTNTHDYWLIQYCTVLGNMWRWGLRSEPRWGAYSALQSPTPSPVKHTSLHNRLNVLKCSKTHLQQTRISKIFRGTNPRSPATGSALEHNEQGRELSNAGPADL